MRDISCEQISVAIRDLCIKAETWLPPDVAMAIECASEADESMKAREVLNDLMVDFMDAVKLGRPICQDTGMLEVFAEIGQDVHIAGGLFDEAIKRGVSLGYAGNLNFIVSDPQYNDNNNITAVINTRLVLGDKLKLTVVPKSFYSESMSTLKIFMQPVDMTAIEDFIVETVSKAGTSLVNPPIVLGIGLGGTVDKCTLIASKALSRPVDQRNSDPFYEKMERQLLKRINNLGIGPKGVGGSTTAIAVNIEVFSAHDHCRPCVINMSGHAARRASVTL